MTGKRELGVWLRSGKESSGRTLTDSLIDSLIDHNTRFSDNKKNYYVAIQASQNSTMHTPVTTVMFTDQHFQSH